MALVVFAVALVVLSGRVRLLVLLLIPCAYFGTVRSALGDLVTAEPPLAVTGIQPRLLTIGRPMELRLTTKADHVAKVRLGSWVEIVGIKVDPAPWQVRAALEETL